MERSEKPLDIPPFIFFAKEASRGFAPKFAQNRKPNHIISSFYCFRAIIVVVVNDDYVYLFFPLIKISLGAERIVTTDDDKSSVETVLLFNCDCDYC